MRDLAGDVVALVTGVDTRPFACVVPGGRPADEQDRRFASTIHRNLHKQAAETLESCAHAQQGTILAAVLCPDASADVHPDRSAQEEARGRNPGEEIVRPNAIEHPSSPS